MDISEIVANNLKALRESRNLSLDQTAKLTSVSKSMLGQIERNEVTPTITLLWKIANGFKVSFTSLTSQKEPEVFIVRSSELIPLSEDGGRFLNYPAFPFSDSRPFEIYRITIKRDGRLDSSPHLPDTEEYITVFSGDVTITAGEDAYNLSGGDSIRFKSDVPHSYSNNGETDAQLCMVIYYPS